VTTTVEVAGKTDVGCIRANNEDSFGYDTSTGLFVVCDGMGGQAAGEVASNIAVDTLIEYFRDSARGDPSGLRGIAHTASTSADLLRRAIELANERIRQAADANPFQTGMGSTIVAALLKGQTVTIAHVGDSRIYLIHEGAIRQLTNDHSLVMAEVRSGLMTLEQAHRSELQSIILRALGAEASVQPDFADVPLAHGDILLLTSDGLVRQVDDDRILQLIESAPNLEGACDALIQAAKDAGGSDNVSCLLLKLTKQNNGSS